MSNSTQKIMPLEPFKVSGVIPNSGIIMTEMPYFISGCTIVNLRCLLNRGKRVTLNLSKQRRTMYI
jgi:hypothetical protein